MHCIVKYIVDYHTIEISGCFVSFCLINISHTLAAEDGQETVHNISTAIHEYKR